MSDRDDDDLPETESTDLPDKNRPMPASGPVINVIPAESPDDAPEAQALEPVESSLLGAGGLPAAEAKQPDADSPAFAAAGAGTGPFARADKPWDTPTDTRDDLDDAPAPLHPDAPVSHDPATAPRRGGFWPLLLGGVAAAAIGAGATLWALPNLPAAWQPAAPAQSVDSAALLADATSAARTEIEARIPAITESAREAATQAATAAMEAAPTAAADTAAVDTLTERVAGLDTRLDELDALIARVQALEDRPLFAPPTAEEAALPADALAPIREQIEAQARQLQQLAARPQIGPDDIAAVRQAAESANEAASAAQDAQSSVAASVQDAQAQIASAAEAAEGRMAEVQQTLDAAQQTLDGLQQALAEVDANVADATRKAAQLAALARFETALQTGGDRAAAVQDLATAGVQAPAALTVDAPSLEALQASYDDAARAGLRASLRAVSGQATPGNTVTNFLRAQTGARSLAPQTGGDPDAVLSRAGAAVADGDIAAALTEIAALPEAGQTAMADWTNGAAAWVSANDALGALQGQFK